MADWLKRGFQRVKVNGEFYEIPDAPALDKKFKHDIDVVVDRIVIRPDLGARLADSLEQALELTDGIAVFEYADEKEENGEARRVTFSSKFACPVSGFTIPRSSPGCSRSTTRSAPAPPATVSATRCGSIRT